MKSVDRILRTHPQSGSLPIEDANVATDAILGCIEACTICADACLAEAALDKLRRCIRANQDCADICDATLRLITRHTDSIAEMVRQQLHACVMACQLCAEECDRHEHEHCRLCAEACRRCQEACNRLLGQISSSGTIPADPLESPPLAG